MNAASTSARVCPFCTTMAIPIIYGAPHDALRDYAQTGHYWLGGSLGRLMLGDAPNWQCPGCRHEWFTPFAGGNGTSPQQAVIICGTSELILASELACQYLYRRFGLNVEVRRQTFVQGPEGEYDLLTVATSDGVERDVFFDVSGCCSTGEEKASAELEPGESRGRESERAPERGTAETIFWGNPGTGTDSPMVAPPPREPFPLSQESTLSILLKLAMIVMGIGMVLLELTMPSEEERELARYATIVAQPPQCLAGQLAHKGVCYSVSRAGVPIDDTIPPQPIFFGTDKTLAHLRLLVLRSTESACATASTQFGCAAPGPDVGTTVRAVLATEPERVLKEQRTDATGSTLLMLAPGRDWIYLPCGGEVIPQGCSGSTRLPDGTPARAWREVTLVAGKSLAVAIPIDPFP
jgi:hypothetical protein